MKKLFIFCILILSFSCAFSVDRSVENYNILTVSDYLYFDVGDEGQVLIRHSKNDLLDENGDFISNQFLNYVKDYRVRSDNPTAYSWLDGNCSLSFNSNTNTIQANFKKEDTYTKYWQFLQKPQTIKYYKNGNITSTPLITTTTQILQNNLMMRAKVNFNYNQVETGSFEILIDNKGVKLNELKKFFRKEVLTTNKFREVKSFKLVSVESIDEKCPNIKTNFDSYIFTNNENVKNPHF